MLILIGPSASGKTEIAKELNTKFHLNKFVTYTTREKRVLEQDGIDYNFVSVEEFKELASKDFFVETTYYNKNYYGSAKKDVTDDKCVILDPNGLKSFNDLHDSRIVSIFLRCDEKVRYERMIGRKDGEEKALSRIENDRVAFDENNIKGITFVVDSSTKSVEELTEEVYQLYQSVLKRD